jgi:hypothetical protein
MPSQERFRARPMWACLEPCPASQNYQFWIGQQPKPQICFFALFTYIFGNVRIEAKSSARCKLESVKKSGRTLFSHGRHLSNRACHTAGMKNRNVLTKPRTQPRVLASFGRASLIRIAGSCCELRGASPWVFDCFARTPNVTHQLLAIRLLAFVPRTTA